MFVHILIGTPIVPLSSEVAVNLLCMIPEAKEYVSDGLHFSLAKHDIFNTDILVVIVNCLTHNIFTWNYECIV